MAIDSLEINNPMIYFRLDPGEPGVRTSAKASESALLVTAQELRNINRLKARAIAEGHDIIYSNITYKPDAVGAYHTISSGHTVVVSAPHKEIPNQVPIDSEDRDSEGIDEEDNNNTENIETLNEIASDSVAGIEEEIEDMEEEIAGLKQKLEAIENQEEEQASGEDAVLMSEIEQKEARLTQLLYKKGLLEMGDSQEAILGGIKDSNKAAFGLVSLKGKGSYQSGSLSGRNLNVVI